MRRPVFTVVSGVVPFVMELDVLDKARAVIVAIEDYCISGGSRGMNKVDYARRDAEAFRDVLIDEFKIPAGNILLWMDQQAVGTQLREELRYIIRNLRQDERFYFYYAGHGFFHAGTNLLSAWDTHPDNLTGTCVSVRESLLEPLQKSECQQICLFLDACAVNLPELGRDLVTGMSQAEFEKFAKPGAFQVVYSASSPGEKARPSAKLQHGIWTYFLLEALRGNAPDAVVKDRYITDVSLRDYLATAVPQYIAQKTTFRDTQTPWASIECPRTFYLRVLPEPEVADGGERALTNVQLDFENAELRNEEQGAIKHLPGFKKGKHFVPDKFHHRVDEFVGTLLQEEIAAEVQEVYSNAKKILGLRRSEFDHGAKGGGGTVNCSFFTYSIDVTQSGNDPAEFVRRRTLHIRVSRDKLPEDFDEVFPHVLDEIVIPFTGKPDFDELVEQFEAVQEKLGGELEDDDSASVIRYSAADGARFELRVDEREFVIRPSGYTRSCLELIKRADASLRALTGSAQLLLR